MEVKQWRSNIYNGDEPLGEWYLSPYLPIIGPDEDFILNMKKIIFYKFTTMHNHRLSIWPEVDQSPLYVQWRSNTYNGDWSTSIRTYLISWEVTWPPLGHLHLISVVYIFDLLGDYWISWEVNLTSIRIFFDLHCIYFWSPGRLLNLLGG